MATGICPTHGVQQVESLEGGCPVKLRKTIAGVAQAGTCGQKLEPAKS